MSLIVVLAVLAAHFTGVWRRNWRCAVASKWLGAFKEEENKHGIVAALHVRGEPRAVGPDEKPKTPEDLAATTAKTTIKAKTEDKKPETPVDPVVKTTEAERLGLIVTWSAGFGYVRPA